MPEGLEAEIYRRGARRCRGRVIARAQVDPRQAAADELVTVLPGTTVTGARRHGKLVLVDLDGGDHVLGLHFGMTGRLVVDGAAAIERLAYASGRDDAAWDRLLIEFADGGVLRVNDPRRWARFTLDPDASQLGPDFLSVTADVLASRLARRRAALKTVLLDQGVVAGYGNLCVDEVLWQAGLAPVRPAASLDPDDLATLVAAAERHLPAMLRRGGSHRGTLDPAVRAEVPPCPRDGAPLRREQVGGRTTVWCPLHQT